MPAYFESGFSVRQPMWHGLGTVLDDYPESWDEARMIGGLMWEPKATPVWVERPLTQITCLVCEARFGHRHFDHEGLSFAGLVTANDCGLADAVHSDGRYFVRTAFQATTRDDTGDALGVVSEQWQAVTHADMGEMLEALVGVDGNVKFETAGVLRGGRSVWALAYLDEPYTIPGDDSATYPYIALLNHHDGSGSAKILPTQVRVVCWNTFSAASAQGDRTGRQVIIRHTGNVAERIEEAKHSLANLRDDVAEYQEIATTLAGINVDDALVRTFLERFIPTPENASERTLNDRAARQEIFLGLYNESPTTDAVRGTAYGLLQTATEYLDHLRPYRSKDTYLTRTMLSAEPIKTGTLKLVRELCAAGSN